jgi:SNF2 family DNA or RNA helicase
MFKLDDYQKKSARLLVQNRRFGLFDEMGVGKTHPTIASSLHVRDSAKAPTLITVPGYAMNGWVEKIAQVDSSATVGVCWQKLERAQREEVLHGNTDFILCNYHMWNTYAAMQKRTWHGFVWDEAHRLRGRNSLWTKKIFQLQNVGNRNRNAWFWFLTGSPMVRNGGDLWPFLHMMDRDTFNGYWDFVRMHCETTIDPWSETVNDGVRDPKKFSNLLSRHSIRRMCKDIPQLASLSSVESTIWVDLPKSVLDAMRAAKKSFILEHPGVEPYEADGGGALVAKLALWCSVPPTKQNPKLDALCELLEDTPERVIVWTWYTNTANAVRERLESKYKGKRKVSLVTGNSSDTSRLDAVRTYNMFPDCILVANIAALNESVDLQLGRRQIFLEESELPQDNDQAIARQKRRGQVSPVQVVRLLARGPKSYVVDVARRELVAARKTGITNALIREILSGPID